MREQTVEKFICNSLSISSLSALFYFLESEVYFKFSDRETNCLFAKKCRCQIHPRRYEYFKRRRQRTLLPEALHCESLPFAESDFKPFAESDFNPLLRVTPLWDSSLNCQLSWEDFQRQASGNHGKERRGLNKGEIRKKNETRKLRGNRQMKKMIPSKKN